MGTNSYSDVCPKCNGNNLMCSSETRRNAISGECLDCGYAYWTEEGTNNFEQLNEIRVCSYDLKPLTKEQYDKIMEKVIK